MPYRITVIIKCISIYKALPNVWGIVRLFKCLLNEDTKKKKIFST